MLFCRKLGYNVIYAFLVLTFWKQICIGAIPIASCISGFSVGPRTGSLYVLTVSNVKENCNTNVFELKFSNDVNCFLNPTLGCVKANACVFGHVSFRPNV